VEELAVALVKLRDLLAGPVAANLNLAIGFNALDGD
jgi:predicted lipoprotein